MAKARLISFAEGPFDGVRMATHGAPEKVVIQMQDGRTHRYENDVIDECPESIVHRMVLTRHRESFNEELRKDERGPS